MELFVIVAIVVALGLLWSMNSRSKQVATLEAARFVAEERERQDRVKAEQTAKHKAVELMHRKRWDSYFGIGQEIAAMSREEYENSRFCNTLCNPKVFRDEVDEPWDWKFFEANPAFFKFLQAHAVDFMDFVDGEPLSTFDVLLEDGGKAVVMVANLDELSDYVSMMSALHLEKVEIGACRDLRAEDGRRIFARTAKRTLPRLASTGSV